jgi:predicted membrane channel-forming protein YqfA (hemolysin III family)
MIATTWDVGQVAYSLLWFFLFVVEIWLAISVFIDIFRSHDLKGWAKAAWVIFVFVLPLIGSLAYLIFRGDKMRAHQAQASLDYETFARDYFQHGFGGHHSAADEISKLAELRDKGILSDGEYEKLKARVIDHQSHAQ